MHAKNQWHVYDYDCNNIPAYTELQDDSLEGQEQW